MSAQSFRVLFLIENVPFSLDTRVRRESHTLMSAGAQITVICPSDGSGAFREIDGVRVYQYPKPTLGASFLGHVGEYLVSLFFHFVLTAWVALRRGFDVVHATDAVVIHPARDRASTRHLLRFGFLAVLGSALARIRFRRRFR
jgi:hypothetical protein